MTCLELRQHARPCLIRVAKTQAELLDGKSSLLQGKLSVLAEQAGKIKAEELSQRREKERLLQCQETLQSELEREADAAESSRRELLERSEELSRGREKVRGGRMYVQASSRCSEVGPL